MKLSGGVFIRKMVVGEPSDPDVGLEVARGGVHALLAPCSVQGDGYM